MTVISGLAACRPAWKPRTLLQLDKFSIFLNLNSSNLLKRISFGGNRWRKFGMADADVPIKYMDRTRHYYRALGYTQDYIWQPSMTCPFHNLPNHFRK